MPSVRAAEAGKATLRLNILLAITNTLGLEISLIEHNRERYAMAAEEAGRYDAIEPGDDRGA